MNRDSLYPQEGEVPLQIKKEDMNGSKSQLAVLIQKLREESDDIKSIHTNLLTHKGENVRVSFAYAENGNVMVRYWVGENIGPGSMTIIKKEDVGNDKPLYNSVPLGATRAMIANVFDKQR